MQGHADQPFGPQRVLREIVLDAVHLAAQPQQDAGRYIGVIQDARDDALQLAGIGSDGVPAAFTMRKRDHSVDAFGQSVGWEGGGDQFHRMRRAVAGGRDGDVISGPRTPVGARVTEERGDFGRALGRGDFGCGKFLANRDFLERQVLRVNMLARMDRRGRSADGAAVADHVLARRDLAQGDLVARGNSACHPNLLAGYPHHLPRRKRHAQSRRCRNMQMDGRRLRGRKVLNLQKGHGRDLLVYATGQESAIHHQHVAGGEAGFTRCKINRRSGELL